MPHHEDRARTAGETAMGAWQPKAALEKQKSEPPRPVRLILGGGGGGGGQTRGQPSPRRTRPVPFNGRGAGLAPARGRSSARHPINLFRSLVSAGIRAGQAGDKRIPRKGVNITRHRAFIQVPAKETLPLSGSLRKTQQPCHRDGKGLRRGYAAISKPPVPSSSRPHSKDRSK
ncbi:uncharacterized protein LY79DRAFT_694897 [Colletotrichum navitas]|uniref:Uncharacterized protein n=1 Tax=Colletotrichum navitas TaxID=681940 RepID=A0AAD8PRY8_9PEZI|nr:uncharacterized protein LY79DRAFT_694897 [Colletotrichum navitas]KAK1579147.1 hypothetical protein LY79DRAFT_694897 [Colletotrichum navitas]